MVDEEWMMIKLSWSNSFISSNLWNWIEEFIKHPSTSWIHPSRPVWRCKNSVFFMEPITPPNRKRRPERFFHSIDRSDLFSSIRSIECKRTSGTNLSQLIHYLESAEEVKFALQIKNAAEILSLSSWSCVGRFKQQETFRKRMNLPYTSKKEKRREPQHYSSWSVVLGF